MLTIMIYILSGQVELVRDILGLCHVRKQIKGIAAMAADMLLS